MTCCLCHREPNQHTLSSSAPTRGKYETHCPAYFPQMLQSHNWGCNSTSRNWSLWNKTCKWQRQVLGIDHWHITNSFIHASGVQFNAPDQTWGQSTPGIEKLAMDQIANNQNYLNNLNVQQGSYTGPRLHLHRTKHKVSSRQQVFSETKLQISVVIYLM